MLIELSKLDSLLTFRAAVCFFKTPLAAAFPILLTYVLKSSAAAFKSLLVTAVLNFFSQVLTDFFVELLRAFFLKDWRALFAADL